MTLLLDSFWCYLSGFFSLGDSACCTNFALGRRWGGFFGFVQWQILVGSARWRVDCCVELRVLIRYSRSPFRDLRLIRRERWNKFQYTRVSPKVRWLYSLLPVGLSISSWLMLYAAVGRSLQLSSWLVWPMRQQPQRHSKTRTTKYTYRLPRGI